MQTVVESLEGNKVKLSITVEEREFEKALDATYRKIAQEVRIPGFRPGKAPRRILEARLGPETARAEAIRTSVPEYYNDAVKEYDVDAIAPPEIDITSGEKGGPLSFDAVVEVRPQIKLAGYGGLRVTVPNPAVTEEEVLDQLARLRAKDGVLTTVDRPARTGDQVSIDLKVIRPAEEGEGSDHERTTEDLLYEIGSGQLGPELDDRLLGVSPGESVNYTVDLPDFRTEGGEPRQLHYQVLVKEVKELVLPEPTDEWASEASEFETVDELVEDIRQRLSVVKRGAANAAMRNGAVDALVELVQEDPPDALVNQALAERAQELENALRQQGVGIGEYLQATGRTQEQLVEELRAQAVQTVKADLALRAVADLEALDVAETDVDDEIGRLAVRVNSRPAAVRRQLESNGQMAAVRSDIRRGKAVEWLVEHLEAVDPEGQLIDRALLDEPLDADGAEDSESPVEAGAAADRQTGRPDRTEAATP